MDSVGKFPFLNPETDDRIDERGVQQRRQKDLHLNGYLLNQITTGLNMSKWRH